MGDGGRMDKIILMNMLYFEQKHYEKSNGTLECLWGYGNNMVEFLKSSHRRIRHE